MSNSHTRAAAASTKDGYRPTVRDNFRVESSDQSFSSQKHQISQPQGYSPKDDFPQPYSSKQPQPQGNHVQPPKNDYSNMPPSNQTSDLPKQPNYQKQQISKPQVYPPKDEVPQPYSSNQPPKNNYMPTIPSSQTSDLPKQIVRPPLPHDPQKSNNHPPISSQTSDQSNQVQSYQPQKQQPPIGVPSKDQHPPPKNNNQSQQQPPPPPPSALLPPSNDAVIEPSFPNEKQYSVSDGFPVPDGLSSSQQPVVAYPDLSCLPPNSTVTITVPPVDQPKSPPRHQAGVPSSRPKPKKSGCRCSIL